MTTTPAGSPRTLKPPVADSSRSPTAGTPRSLQSYLDENTDDKDEVHFTLRKSVDLSKYNQLNKLQLKLTTSNYSTWSTTVYHALEKVGLHIYLADDFPQPADHEREFHKQAIRWAKANNFILSILTASMTEEAMTQLAHYETACQIWDEAHCPYAGTTVTDWMLTIASLVNMKHKDGEDIATHITKMKGYRHNIILMNCNINDNLFTCFLRLSMPPSWNIAFTALPDHYTSAEVEHGIRLSQTKGSNTLYQASQGSLSRSGLSRTPVPGQPYCNNCKITGHWTRDCYSKGGLKNGQNWKDKEKLKKDKQGSDKDTKPKKGKERSKPKSRPGKRANEAVAKEDKGSEDEPRSDTEHSSYLANCSSHSHFGWILDSGSTNHICTKRSAFVTFTPTRDHISGIVKDGPQLEVLGYGTIMVSVSV
ncbi:hypothetical protein PAXINDRAFT_8654 [Paxillus involutus ATCC 200175]|nr:hypothetical protein PAXINDRAFT_8654 [Paxillus involutus ATCC 200175]